MKKLIAIVQRVRVSAVSVHYLKRKSHQSCSVLAANRVSHGRRFDVQVV